LTTPQKTTYRLPVWFRPEVWLLVLAVAIHATFWISLQVGWLDPLFNDATHRLQRGYDFYAVFQKSYEFGHGGSLYTDVDYRAQAAGGLVVPYCAANFRYLPSWGWFMSWTLCQLPAETAYWVWVSAIELMFLFCLWLFWRRTAGWRARIWLMVIWLAYFPYYLELFVGQFSFMATGLLTLCLLSFRDRRHWRRVPAKLGSVL